MIARVVGSVAAAAIVAACGGHPGAAGSGGVNGGGGTAGAGGSTATVPSAWRCAVPGVCDPFLTITSCAANQVCLPTLESDGYGPTSCYDESPNPVGDEQPCGLQECGPAHGCVPIVAGAFECARLCPVGSSGFCGPDRYCGVIAGGAVGCIGACYPIFPACDIYAQDCPGPGDACAPDYDEERARWYSGCQAAGQATEGESCAYSRCGAGLVCVDNGGSYYCEPPCHATADCSPGKICVATRFGPLVHACQPDPGTTGAGGAPAGTSQPWTPIFLGVGGGGGSLPHNPLAQATIDAFVNAHNAARMGPLDPPPSPPLPPVAWDPQLADIAYGALSTCPVLGIGDGSVIIEADIDREYAALGGRDYLGQNIYATAQSPPPASDPEDAVAAWLRGGLSYDYTTNTGTPGGYTQLVWRSSVRIGCAIFDCPNVRLRNNVFCTYAPAGNYNGERPY